MQGPFSYALFGRLVKDCRKRKKMTQAMLAEKVNVEVSFISKIERAVSTPSLQLFITLVLLLDIPVAELFDASKSEQEIRLLSLTKGCSAQEMELLLKIGEAAIDALRND